MNETVIWILELPLVIRALALMVLIWLAYVVLSKFLVMIIISISILVNWLWLVLYKFINGLVHIIHHRFGKRFIGIDQGVTDFFGSVYIFIERINVLLKKLKAKRFIGSAFFICMLLAVWIAFPIWVHAEHDKNLFTAPYHKYLEFESNILDGVFGGK